MDILEDLKPLSSGAVFLRADLHLHSFGERGSYDVSDASMTPDAIIETALQERLGIIAITDHNAIGNVEAALRCAAGKDILVVPGIELSTPQGHLLVYVPAFRDLERLYGQLQISVDRKTCTQSIQQCLDLAQQLGGFGIAAHIDLSTGLEGMMPRFDLFKEAVLCHEALLGLEISTSQAETWYTERDANQDRKRLHGLRMERHREDQTYELPRIMGSDAHTLTGLGKNAAGARKLTRIKLDHKSFDALKIALLDPTARVRIEDLIPPDIPHFVGLKLSGGFLDGQVVRFSRNLNCIIGGRGTGKSTLLESLRAGCGNEARESLIDSDVWPDQILLLYQDQAGQQQLFSRSKFGSVTNLTDPIFGITRASIESYGQGETAETIQHCDEKPEVLLDFLDGFVELAQFAREDDLLREQLLKNQTELERLRIDVNAMPEVQRAKANAEAQLKVLKEKDASAIVELEEKLARGKRFKKELIDHLNSLFKTYKDALADTGLAQLVSDLDGSQLVVGKDEFAHVKGLVDEFVLKIRGLSADIQTASKDTIGLIQRELQQWGSKEAETQGQIDTIRKDLESRNIKLDMAYIRKVTKDVADFTSRLNELKSKQGALVTGLAARRDLIKSRREFKSHVYMFRQAFADQLNENLKATVVDYFVTVRFQEGLLSHELAQIIQREMNWRTSQVPRAALIASTISPFQLLDAIDKKNAGILTSITDADRHAVFSHSEATTILQTLAKESVRHEIERCQVEDRPQIVVTKEVDGPNGKKLYQRRQFSKLSLGQQQSVLLSILLFSKSNEPLVIDQPEDNLDSEFIYKTFVRSLRRVKETRQVIVVTHNANIAVLGDAELILPLRASSEKSTIRDRGSIDNPATKDLACTILEGSRDAFKRRQRMYGH